MQYLRLRRSIKNANRQQANEHVMADWEGINERAHTHRHTQMRAGPACLTELQEEQLFPACSSSIPGGKHAI